MPEPTDGYRPIPIELPPTGVFVFESHHRPGFRMAVQRHDFLELFYVLDGAGTFYFPDQALPCRRGDLIAVPPGLWHRIADHPTGPLALYGVAVAPSVWQGEPELFAHRPAARWRLNDQLAGRVRADLKRLLFEQTHARLGGRTLILGLTLQLLALLARAVFVTPPGRIRNDAYLTSRQAVEHYVAELPHRFLEATNLDAAAAELGLSRRRLTQLFRAVTGSTWAVYLARLRIEYACRLLRETSRSVLSTAFACGYDDLSTFYRVFRRHTGLTPHQWRARFRCTKK